MNAMSASKLQSEITESAGAELVQRLLVRELVKPGELVDLVNFATKRLSKALLAAEDPEDLRFKIDEVLEGPDFQHVAALMLNASRGHEVPTDGELHRRITERLGQAVAMLASEALRYMDAAVPASLRLLKLVDSGKVAVAESAPGAATSPLAYLTAPDTHPTIAKLLLARDRAKVAVLGLLAVAGSGPAWLTVELATLWRDGERSALTILASVPGTEVPAALVPESARLDYAALDREMQAARRGADALAAEMKRRGVDSLSVGEFLGSD